MTAKEGKAACERIMRHTPGPWGIYPEDSLPTRVYCDDIGGSLVADCGGYTMIPYETKLANAQLIAAAPDMIDALIAISPLVDTFINQTPSGEARNHLTDLNILIKSAIDKATKP